MQCPYCSADSNVVDSRSVSDGVRRRRVCGSCKRRFTTYERVAPPNIKVVKRSGKSEAFDPGKIVTVLARVCRDRPHLAEADFRRIASALEAQLLDERVKSISSGILVERVLARLGDLDKLATDRLAANYLDESGQLRTRPRDTDDDAGQLGLFDDGD